MPSRKNVNYELFTSCESQLERHVLVLSVGRLRWMEGTSIEVLDLSVHRGNAQLRHSLVVGVGLDLQLHDLVHRKPGNRGEY